MSNIEASWIGNPPEDTREVLHYCDACGEEIREGDSFFDGGSEILCERCGEDYMRSCWKEASK